MRNGAKKPPVGATGLEPVTVKSEDSANKELTEKQKTGTAQKLPRTCNSDIKSLAENDTDLQQIIIAWPSLPEHIKAAIKALVQTYIKNKENK